MISILLTGYWRELCREAIEAASLIRGNQLASSMARSPITPDQEDMSLSKRVSGKGDRIAVQSEQKKADRKWG